uniref:BZIP domain-containing protein n=1 Tax=Oryza punctata TaxID=4537 RepID=A0A0E0K5M4_ORYPU
MTPLPLARQGSVYSLTFDEFQSTLGGVGKDFGSMNMDELLRSIWTAEESHAVGPATTSSSAAVAAAEQVAVGAPVQRQGSLTLPRTLSQKTVDEVWRDMMCFGGGASAAPAAAEPPPPAQRQQTLGEITLEEFLVRAGVVREDMSGLPVPPAPTPTAAAVHPPPPPQQQTPMLFGQSNVFPPIVPPLSLGNGLVSGAVGHGGGGAASLVSPVRPVSSSNGFGKMEGGDLSSLSPSPVPYVFNGGLRGRKAPGIEKAYMMELEAEVAKLKELNDELQKKQDEMLEQQKNEVIAYLGKTILLLRIGSRENEPTGWTDGKENLPSEDTDGSMVIEAKNLVTCN